MRMLQEVGSFIGNSRDLELSENQAIRETQVSEAIQFEKEK
jgi:hypothetical protein